MALLHSSKTMRCVGDQIQGAHLGRLCRIAEQAPPLNETRAYRILFILGTFATILASACILSLILSLVPSPAPPTNDKTLSPTSLEQDCTPGGAKRGAMRGSASPSGNRSEMGQTIDGARGPTTPSPAESTSTKAPSRRRTKTSGVHAVSDGTTSPELQDNLPSLVAGTRPPDPTLPDNPHRNWYPKPTPTAEPGVYHGTTSNPVPAERPSSTPTVGARKTIIKSLYPQSGAIGQDRDDAASAQAHSPRQSQLAPHGEASLAVISNLVTWFILVIAVGAHGIQDPEADLHFIIRTFKSSKVHLVSLLNGEATHTSIQRELDQLYLRAQQNLGSQILVYLTGSGDSSGNMSLFGSASISVQDLQRWLAKLYAKPSHPQPTLGVIFDICRNGVARSDPSIDPDLPIVWSCSAGQWAYALKLGQNLPSSSFLLSLFLAAHDSRVKSIDFEHAFGSRLAQQSALIRFIYDKGHKSACAQCSTVGPCRPPSPQESEYREAGRDTFLRLGDLIRAESPDIAHRIHDEITGKMVRWKFLDPEPWYRSFQPWRWMQSLVNGLATKYPRGSSPAVAQAASDLS